MSCRKAFDLDLVACLLDRARPEWTAFRDHYPTCPDCTTEVLTWTELQDGAAPVHPEPSQLLRFEDAPDALSARERVAIGEHVAACAACRDELVTLKVADVGALVRAGSAVAEPAPVIEPMPARPRLAARATAWLRGLVFHPAFAYGIALVLLVPVVRPYLSGTQAFRAPVTLEAVATNTTASVGTHADSDDRMQMGERRQAPAARAVRPDATVADELAAATEAPAAAAPTIERFRAMQDVRRGRVVAEKSAGDPSWIRVLVTPGGTHLMTADPPGIELVVPVPTSATTAGLGELRIRDASGQRELRELHFGPPAAHLTMRVPAAWLVPGRYTVALAVGDDAPLLTATLQIAAR